MKEHRKQFLSAILALLMVIGMLPATVFAAGTGNPPAWTDSSTWDAGFAAMVNKQLDETREPDTEITKEDMESLNTLKLSISDTETMDINGIQFASNLRALYIDGHVEGLKSLTYCGSLTILDISYDDTITDLQEISLPGSLKTLRVNYCSNFTSLDGLGAESLPNLETLDLSRNDALNDISALQDTKLSNLSSVDFENCSALKDISPLKGYASLTYLNLEKVEITEATRAEYRATVSSLTGLEELYLPYCELTDEDTAMFAPLQNLQTLGLGVNNLTSTEFCKQLPAGIKTLSLYGNNVQDTSGLSGLVNLEILGLGDNQITDFTFVQNMPELTNGSIRHMEGDEAFPFLETYYYNNGERVEIEAGGTLVLENPYVDTEGRSISFLNAEVSVDGEPAGTVTIAENGASLTLSNAVPGRITITARYDLPTKESTFNQNLYKVGKLRIMVEAAEPDRYTLSYGWGTDVPDGVILPVDNTGYATQAEAAAAVDTTFIAGMTVKGEKDGKEGIWTFSGWTVSLEGQAVKATGKWSFAEHQHDWGKVSYTWTEDMAFCTAERVCQTDPSHVERETANAEAETTKPATCISKGENTYTAAFQNDWAMGPVIQVREDTSIDADAHDWNEGAVTTPATCTEEGVFTYICRNDTGHTKAETIPVNSEAHAWGEWIVTEEPTVDTEGEETRICKNNPTHTESRIMEKLEAPAVPENPEDPSEPTPLEEEKPDGGAVPQTGATGNPVVWTTLMGLGAAGTAATVLLRKRRGIEKQ